MKVSNEAHKIACKILEAFDPDRLRDKQLNTIVKKASDIDGKLKEMEDAPLLSESLQAKYKKWDMMEQQISLEEQKEEVNQTDFNKEAQVKEMMGCARDHSKEIDIYNKTYDEKLFRITSLKDQANKHFKE